MTAPTSAHVVMSHCVIQIVFPACILGVLPLVIIFGDFEGFSPAVVQDFVTICRCSEI